MKIMNLLCILFEKYNTDKHSKDKITSLRECLQFEFEFFLGNESMNFLFSKFFLLITY